jgi:predicted Fe-Mo cluster-binding NifX family protein
LKLKRIPDGREDDGRDARRREIGMSERMVLAIPTLGEGGLEGERSAHFGHCDCFTVLDIVDGEISDVRVVPNPPHVEGGCLRPVGLLAAEGVSALLAGGMGPRPLAGFNEAGIDVYFENQTPSVREAVTLLIEGGVQRMDALNTCGHHH